MPDYFSDIGEISVDLLLVAKQTLHNPKNEYNCFTVPEFQRRYAWDKTNWQKFWEDAEDHVENEDNWFLGSMITLTVPRNAQSTARLHEVIDGQQRLTTIFIFRMVIFDVLNDILSRCTEDTKFDIADYQRLIINIAGKDRLIHSNDYVTSSPSQTRLMQIYDYYVAHDFNVRPDRRTKYHDAFVFFKHKFSEVLLNKDPKEQFTIVLNYFSTVSAARLIWAQVSSLPHAMSMFEVLNNRGKPLGVTDIVKTSILKRWTELEVQLEPHDQHIGVQRKVITQSGDLWKRVQKFVYAVNMSQSTQPEKYDDATLKRFVRHFYILYSPVVDEKNVYANLTEKQMLQQYEKLMSQITTKNDMRNFHSQLQLSAAYYGFLRAPLDWKFDLNNADMFIKFLNRRSTTHTEFYVAHLLSDINTMGLVQINLLLLYILNLTFTNMTNDNEYKMRVTKLHQVMSSIMCFVIRRNITDTPRPNKMDGILAGILQAVAKENSSVVMKLDAINTRIHEQISLSSRILADELHNIRYDKSLNSDIRFILHFIEKWRISESSDSVNKVLVLHNHSSLFDGFRVPLGQKSPEFQIEHIMPKSLLAAVITEDGDDDEDESAGSTPGTNSDRWLADLNRWGSNFSSMQDEEKEALIHSLGNLTFLNHNAKLGDSIFAEKQNHLTKKNVQVGYQATVPAVLNEFVVSKDSLYTLKTSPQWTEHEIQIRTREIHERLLSLLDIGGSLSRERNL